MFWGIGGKGTEKFLIKFFRENERESFKILQDSIQNNGISLCLRKYG